ncbi:MAG: protein-methionine-sulfoxide reductase catalytic subunit MsrP [Anaerolineae bacterium]
MIPIKPSEITPERVYLSRRQFIKRMGLATAGAALLAACGQRPGSQPTAEGGAKSGVTPTAPSTFPTRDAETDELGAPLTPYDAITGYTNFYEFSLQKEAVDELTAGFQTSPWTVEVGGLVNNPRTFDLDDLLKFEQEERVYRMRCVEAWSMVIPWVGFPLKRLLDEVEPTSQANYVRFQTRLDDTQMPGVSNRAFPWPYVEGLRMDEALHDLTLMATGLYGKPLPPQNGAPLRLVVPWKYGFKSIKSVVKIELVEEMPTTFWMAAGPTEYGFWANVNPEVDHPRWSQATERRIGENERIDTLYFNGYADEVADLYDNLDDRKWYF